MRFHDGSRRPVKLNHTHTVADLHNFVASATPGVAFDLMITYPRRKVRPESWRNRFWNGSWWYRTRHLDNVWLVLSCSYGSVWNKVFELPNPQRFVYKEDFWHQSWWWSGGGVVVDEDVQDWIHNRRVASLPLLDIEGGEITYGNIQGSESRTITSIFYVQLCFP